jgi:hypothetical protein
VVAKILTFQVSAFVSFSPQVFDRAVMNPGYPGDLSNHCFCSYQPATVWGFNTEGVLFS